jgi:MFS family permease
MILLGIGTMALAQLLFLAVRAEWQLILPGVVHGIAQAILYPNITAAGTSAFPDRHRGLGTTVMLATLDLGQLIGAPVAGMILHGSEALGWASYPTMFVAMAGALTAAAVTYARSLQRGTEKPIAALEAPLLPPAPRVAPQGRRIPAAAGPQTTARQVAGSSGSTAAAPR